MFRHIAPPAAKKVRISHTALGVTVFPGARALENEEDMDTSAVDTAAIYSRTFWVSTLSMFRVTCLSTPRGWL